MTQWIRVACIDVDPLRSPYAGFRVPRPRRARSRHLIGPALFQMPGRVDVRVAVSQVQAGTCFGRVDGETDSPQREFASSRRSQEIARRIVLAGLGPGN